MFDLGGLSAAGLVWFGLAWLWFCLQFINFANQGHSTIKVLGWVGFNCLFSGYFAPGMIAYCSLFIFQIWGDELPLFAKFHRPAIWVAPDASATRDTRLMFFSNLNPCVALRDKLWRVTIGLLLFSKLSLPVHP